MELHFPPDLERTLAQLAKTTGRPTDSLVQDAVAAYLDELADIRETLGRRYDDLQSGRVQPIDGEDALARLRGKSEQRRSGSA